jgi:hypothetical protein
MKTESESAIQPFSVRMAEGPNSDCKRSATHSPHRWCEFHSVRMAGRCKFVQLRKLFLTGGALLKFLILACSMLCRRCCLCDAFCAQRT